jgi:hypothetical protein
LKAARQLGQQSVRAHYFVAHDDNHVQLDVVRQGLELRGVAGVERKTRS